MRENTPPQLRQIEDDEGEVIYFDNEEPPPEDEDDDDDDEPEEGPHEDFDRLLDRYEDDDGANRAPVEDVAELTFTQHTKPVYGCTLHLEHDIAATGGEDDKAFVWNTKTGEVLHEFDNHKDTVTETHFNYDGTYLAIGDMAGELEVFRFNESHTELHKVWEFSMGDMTWMRWHRCSNVLMAGSDNGEVYFWRIPAGDCKILPGFGVKCEASDLSGDGKKLFVSYANGVLKLWDIKQCKVLMEVSNQHPMGHTEMVAAVACDKDGSMYMSGGQDEKILFCTSTGPLASVDISGPVECVAFSPSTEHKWAASGTLNGEISVWDCNKFALRSTCAHPEMDDGITRLKWISDYTLLVGTIRGHVFGYDARTGVRKFELSGHRGIIYEIQYDARTNTVLTVSDDHTAKIFKVPQLGD